MTVEVGVQRDLLGDRIEGHVAPIATGFTDGHRVEGIAIEPELAQQAGRVNHRGLVAHGVDPCPPDVAHVHHAVFRIGFGAQYRQRSPVAQHRRRRA